jgi:hypothetical protein
MTQLQTTKQLNALKLHAIDNGGFETQNNYFIGLSITKKHTELITHLNN